MGNGLDQLQSTVAHFGVKKLDLTGLLNTNCPLWLITITTCLGMTHCEVNHTIFYGWWSTPPHESIPMPSSGDNLILMVPIHVDDGLAVTNSIPLYTWFIFELSKELEVVDLGPVSMFLEIHIHCDHPRWKIYLSQKSFISDLLDTWNMTSWHPSPIPLHQKLHELPPSPPNSLSDIKNDDDIFNTSLEALSILLSVPTLTSLTLWWH